jgi:glycosyltransferase involved in cell wall biosynthesis
MTNACVTVGVPVYRGQKALPVLLECLRTQSYKEIEVLISVDGGDQASAEAAKPFLQQDSRFRMHVHASRLGWAGNTDWTMRQRSGDFYIYQQHDDLISPTYIADLVEAAARWPGAVICFAKLQVTGLADDELCSPSLLGGPKERVLSFLETLDWVPFRGLIRGSALDKTSGLLLDDCDPFESYGTEHRFVAELALLGEFRFVEGPTYFKSWHGENLSAKRDGWSREHVLRAFACFAAWMIEVIAPVGGSVDDRRRLFRTTLDRFAGRQDRWKDIRSALRNRCKAFFPVPIWNQLKRSQRLRAAVQGPLPGPHLLGLVSTDERYFLFLEIFERLKRGGRFDSHNCLGMGWGELKSEILRQSQHRIFGLAGDDGTASMPGGRAS